MFIATLWQSIEFSTNTGGRFGWLFISIFLAPVTNALLPMPPLSDVLIEFDNSKPKGCGVSATTGVGTMFSVPSQLICSRVTRGFLLTMRRSWKQLFVFHVTNLCTKNSILPELVRCSAHHEFGTLIVTCFLRRTHFVRKFCPELR